MLCVLSYSLLESSSCRGSPLDSHQACRVTRNESLFKQHSTDSDQGSETVRQSDSSTSRRGHSEGHGLITRTWPSPASDLKPVHLRQSERWHYTNTPFIYTYLLWHFVIVLQGSVRVCRGETYSHFKFGTAFSCWVYVAGICIHADVKTHHRRPQVYHFSRSEALASRSLVWCCVK